MSALLNRQRASFTRTVEVVHKPTEQNITLPDSKGGYASRGLDQGPYTKVTYVGYQTTEITEINALRK
jgi:hypothetical protein